MKKLFPILLLMILILSCTEHKSEQLSVMSFNIRYDTEADGDLINYYHENFINKNIQGNDRPSQFGFFYAFWSPDKRVVLKTTKTSQEKINSSIQSDLLRLKVQLLLDISRIDDSLHCQTYSVFDSHQSFCYIPATDVMQVVTNIYFDLCEIERRKLDAVLQSQRWSLNEIDSIYQHAIKEMDELTKTFLKEVKMGNHLNNLQKWNIYIIKHLNIDNIAMMEETIKNRPKQVLE